MTEMKFNFRAYRLRIYPVTPVHIFGGEELDRFDYVLRGYTFRRIDLYEFFRNLNIDNYLDEFLSLDFSNLVKVLKKIDELIDTNESALKKATVWSAGISESAHKHLSSLDEKALYPVKTFVRGGIKHKAYIPGSAVKGSINTAFMFRLRKQGKFSQEMLNKMLEKAILGSSPNDSLGRLIRISDTVSAGNRGVSTYIFKAKRIRKGIVDKKMQIPQFVECWYDAKKGAVEDRTYSEHILELVDAPKNAEIKTFGFKLKPNEIAEICNEYYLGEIAKNENRDLREEIEQRLKKFDEGAFVFKLGWGSGVETFTLNSKRAKTRWVADGGQRDKDEPFGWCVAQIIE